MVVEQLVICKYGIIDIYNLDPLQDKWSLICNNFKMKEEGNIYSINESYKYLYDNKYNEFIDSLIKKSYNMRWVGSMVADFHRTLIKGGIILYPGNIKNKNGKIRILYEAYPFAYIIEKAGGFSNDGEKSILKIDFPLIIYIKELLYFLDPNMKCLNYLIKYLYIEYIIIWMIYLII